MVCESKDRRFSYAAGIAIPPFLGYFVEAWDVDVPACCKDRQPWYSTQIVRSPNSPASV